MAELDVIRVARYVENSYGEEQGVYLLDKEFRVWLQKVLYFLQGYSLKIEGQPLFKADFVLEKRGPMDKAVHKALKSTPPSEADDTLNRPFVDEMILFLSKYSSEDLTNASHESLPWVKAHNDRSTSLDETLTGERWGQTDFEKLLIENVRLGAEKRKARQAKVNGQKDFFFAETNQVCEGNI